MKGITNDILIKLLQLPGIGRKTAFKIIEKIPTLVKSDNELFDLISNKLVISKSFDENQINNAITKGNGIIAKNTELGIKSTSFYDNDFPKNLKNISDPPIIIYSIGDLSMLNELQSIGIIGTRQPTNLGNFAAKRYGEIFAENNFNIISGLALGCDTSAHQGCLEKSGFTTAVLAHGLDTVYPKENKGLADKIINSGGVLLSEYCVGVSSIPNYFIERNRIQAGLSDGIIVVETAKKGGTMHTVAFAKKYKKHIGVFNHPKNTKSHVSMEGNKLLIKDGCISLSDKNDLNFFQKKLLDSRIKFNSNNLKNGDQLSLL